MSRLLDRNAVVVCGVILAMMACSNDKESDSAFTVGPAGGVFTSSQGVVLDIPENALDHTVTLGVAKSGTQAPDGYIAVSDVYAFSPSGTSFAKPITITIPYSRTAAGDHALSFYYTLAGQETVFDAIDGAVIGDGKGSAAVSHFSRGFIGYRSAECVSEAAQCGDSISGDTTGQSAQLDGYPLVDHDESGPENVYKITLGETTTLIVEQQQADFEADYFLLEVCGEVASLHAWGDNGFVADCLEPGDYYIVVDGRDGASGTFSYTIGCDVCDDEDGDSDSEEETDNDINDIADETDAPDSDMTDTEQETDAEGDDEACTEGDYRCNGDWSQYCSASGQWGNYENCTDSGKVCISGACTAADGDAESPESELEEEAAADGICCYSLNNVWEVVTSENVCQGTARYSAELCETLSCCDVKSAPLVWKVMPATACDSTATRYPLDACKQENLVCCSQGSGDYMYWKLAVPPDECSDDATVRTVADCYADTSVWYSGGNSASEVQYYGYLNAEETQQVKIGVDDITDPEAPTIPPQYWDVYLTGYGMYLYTDWNGRTGLQYWMQPSDYLPVDSGYHFGVETSCDTEGYDIYCNSIAVQSAMGVYAKDETYMYRLGVAGKLEGETTMGPGSFAATLYGFSGNDAYNLPDSQLVWQETLTAELYPTYQIYLTHPHPNDWLSCADVTITPHGKVFKRDPNGGTLADRYEALSMVDIYADPGEGKEFLFWMDSDDGTLIFENPVQMMMTRQYQMIPYCVSAP